MQLRLILIIVTIVLAGTVWHFSDDTGMAQSVPVSDQTVRYASEPAATKSEYIYDGNPFGTVESANAGKAGGNTASASGFNNNRAARNSQMYSYAEPGNTDTTRSNRFASYTGYSADQQSRTNIVTTGTVNTTIVNSNTQDNTVPEKHNDTNPGNTEQPQETYQDIPVEQPWPTPDCPLELAQGSDENDAKAMQQAYGCRYMNYCQMLNDGDGNYRCWWGFYSKS